MKLRFTAPIIIILCLMLTACASGETTKQQPSAESPASQSTTESPASQSPAATPESQSPSAAPVVSDDPDWKLVWNDEFDGASGSAPDPAKWAYDTGTGSQYGMAGWGNNELQYYTDTRNNSYIENGNLVIKANKENMKGSAYTSAKLITKGKADWLYGKIEIRAKMPIGQGLWPAFWMMPTFSKYGGWPASGEIDIMEYLGHQPNTVHATLHYGNPWKYTTDIYISETTNFTEDYHIFTFLWDPGVMRWYVDGKEYQTLRDWYSSGGEYPAPFDQKFFLQLNMAVGGNMPGNPDDTTVFPQYLNIDYVRVFQRTGELPTPGPKPTPEPTPTPRPADPSGNLLYNGDMSDGSNYWELGDYEGGKSSMSVEDGAIKVSISNGGNQFYSSQLIQKPIFIEEGATYSVSFDAWSDAERNMTVSVGMSGAPWDTYSGQQSIDLTKEKKTYTFEFKMEKPSDAQARIDINMGLSTSAVYLDNFVITKK